MTTTPATCSHCGTAFTEANPPSRAGLCRDAWACVERKWAKEKDESQRRTANDTSTTG